MQNKKFKFIISGGGTGGHVFPAISIGNAIKSRYAEAEILFVGANGRLEMQKVPDAGFKIIGLPVSGLIRKPTLKNLTVGVKLLKSMFKARKIIREFKPDIAIGVGGYASGPIIGAASWAGIPTLLQEQNSYAGITNKLLAKNASVICVAYDNMERYFPKEKLVLTGNPVRQDINNLAYKREEAFSHFKLDKGRKTILILGGSLGANTLNQSILPNIEKLTDSGMQLIWQCGKNYYAKLKQSVENRGQGFVQLMDFINRMDLAYAAADIIISRAGAGTISELCLAGKPVILVPSPNVAEDHQTKNARALSLQGAAIFISDKEAPYDLANRLVDLVYDTHLCTQLSQKIRMLAIPDSAERIVNEIDKIINK